MSTNGDQRMRWTDERLDHFANSVADLRESSNQQRLSIQELRESSNQQRLSIENLRESSNQQRLSIQDLRDNAINLRNDVIGIVEGIAETNDSIDGMRLTTQALLQVAAQHQQAERQRQEEMELSRQEMREVQQEIREINERLDVQQGQIRVLLEKLLSS